MAKAKANKETPQAMPYVVQIQAGSGAAQKLNFEITGEQAETLNVGQVITYGLEEVNHNRQQKRIATIIQEEQRGQHGINANQNIVNTGDRVLPLFEDREVQGQKYRGLDIVVSQNQTGGYSNLIERLSQYNL